MLHQGAMVSRVHLICCMSVAKIAKLPVFYTMNVVVEEYTPRRLSLMR